MDPLDVAQLEALKGAFAVIVAQIAFAGAVLSGVMAFVGTWLSSRLTFRAHRRTLFVSTVTTERAQWRAELRQASADFVALVYKSASGARVDVGDLHRRRLDIRLRLNPNGGRENHLDEKILQGLEDIGDVLRRPGTFGLAEVQRPLEAVEDGIQRLLKQEWDKSKDEAASGQLKRPSVALRWALLTSRSSGREPRTGEDIPR